MRQRPMPQSQRVVVDPRNWSAIFAVVGVGLLVLGASLLYVSESRHLDDPIPMTYFVPDPEDLSVLNRKGWNLPHPEGGKPSYTERENRRIALWCGIASLTVGAATLAGAWLMRRKSP